MAQQQLHVHEVEVQPNAQTVTDVTVSLTGNHPVGYIMILYVMALGTGSL